MQEKEKVIIRSGKDAVYVEDSNVVNDNEVNAIHVDFTENKLLLDTNQYG